MRSYRDLFRTPEFTPLFLAASAQTLARTTSGLALATLVHRETASPLLTALSMFGPSLAHVLGATLFMSAADRLPPRATSVGTALAFTATTALLALPGLPLTAVFAVLLVQGLVASVSGGVGWGLLNEILPKDGYLLGRSVFNMMHGLTQVTGYATGGILLTLLSPRLSLLLAAALYGTAALVARLGLTRRPPRATGRPSVRATRHANARLWSSPARRHVYLGLWIPNGLIVGCESLYVSHAPHSAGVLFACAAAGMLAGDVAVGRLIPADRRRRLTTPLLLLLATPYLPLVLHPPLAVTAVLVTVASVGFGASLVQQERLMAVTPPDLSGHALGLHSSGMLTMQGVSAALAGGLAQLTSPAAAMTTLAAASTAVTLLLASTRKPTTPPRDAPSPDRPH
ncbi:MFS transporter [Streptomyces sp. NPDC060077]|uniref:MFS transporter n=1 Tax=Streptomyces sp. NPDC060077 TaxID=3347052 RepID=UPI0036635884